MFVNCDLSLRDNAFSFRDFNLQSTRAINRTSVFTRLIAYSGDTNVRLHPRSNRIECMDAYIYMNYEKKMASWGSFSFPRHRNLMKEFLFTSFNISALAFACAPLTKTLFDSFDVRDPSIRYMNINSNRSCIMRKTSQII